MPKLILNDVVAKLDPPVVHRLVSIVERAWPGWTGFDDSRYLKVERDYKVAAIHKARGRLAEDEIRRLVVSKSFDELIERVVEVAKYTNLLYLAMPEKGDLGLVLHPDLDKAAFASQFLDLLYGEGTSDRRLGRFADWVDSEGLPNRWTFPTYYLFLLHPDREMFVKPETTTGFFEAVGRNIPFRGRPQPGLYNLLLEVSKHLLGMLEEYEPRDMVDIQSFLYMVAQNRFEEAAGGPDTNYWKISPGENAKYWDLCKSGGFTSIGWDSLGDVRELEADEFERHFRDVGEQVDEGDSGWGSGGRDQVWKFLHQVKPGDYVVANRGTRAVLGIGRVVGEATFHEEGPQKLRIPVDWFDTRERSVQQPGWRRTLTQLDRERFDEILGSPSPTAGVFAETLQDIAAQTSLEMDTLERWKRALHRKGQAILYGPPGTGKTFLAELLARNLVAEGDGIRQLVQFHPSYSYEDFMQGIRPDVEDDRQLVYRQVDGTFLRFCRRAAEREGISVLILDEINRANLSRVFGELMYLLEYREQSITLPSGEDFTIPRNVRLLGTMNTADRSIALVDHALRRRFAFLRLDPNFKALHEYHHRRDTGFDPTGLIQALERVNEAIDDPSYSVGISYFCCPDLDERLEDIWRMEIEPYLEEYFFDDRDKLTPLRFDRLESLMRT